MKIILVNEAVYDLNNKGGGEIPYSAFKKMLQNGVDPVDSPKMKTPEDLPRVRLFKTLDEFKQIPEHVLEKTFDLEKPIQILKNGELLIYYKAENGSATDTKKD